MMYVENVVNRAEGRPIRVDIFYWIFRLRNNSRAARRVMRVHLSPMADKFHPIEDEL